MVGDVTSAADVRRVLDQIGAEHPPLRGVFHAAMVLDDEALTVLDEGRFQQALRSRRYRDEHQDATRYCGKRGHCLSPEWDGASRARGDTNHAPSEAAAN